MWFIKRPQRILSLFEAKFPATFLQQNHALDRAVTGTGVEHLRTDNINIIYNIVILYILFNYQYINEIFNKFLV